MLNVVIFTRSTNAGPPTWRNERASVVTATNFVHSAFTLYVTHPRQPPNIPEIHHPVLLSREFPSHIKEPRIGGVCTLSLEISREFMAEIISGRTKLAMLFVGSLYLRSTSAITR